MSNAHNEIKTILQNAGFVFENIRGMEFDGAANMSSKSAGVQAIIKQDSLLATYIHCAGHCLNLVIVLSCSLTNTRNMLDKLKAVCLFLTQL